MTDDTGGKLFVDKHRYILDWLIEEPSEAASRVREDSDKRISSLISILTQEKDERNVLHFKPRKK
ncbi:MAG: hypothetical protein ACE5GY_04920 [Thermodesulfobacteriota bacterium]